MLNKNLNHTNKGGLTRREFMWLSSLAAAGYVFGCATDPVTGKKQFMLVSEDTEIQIDKQYAPLQFSTDYGSVQDSKLNRYVSQVGNKMAASSHRPHMPYSFRVVNATYINAYAFPGGSIAATRGIMLSLDNEAELAALLGHELGHVNARHSAEQMSKGQLTQAVVGGISVLAVRRWATWPASWARSAPVHCWHRTAGITNAKQMPWAWNIWLGPAMVPRALSG
jgi:predicted Zn-dependent protease